MGIAIDDESFAPRATIRGRLSVGPGKRTFCDRLELRFVIVTKSVGYDARSSVHAHELERGEWGAEAFEIPFEIAAPKYPPTYNGELFQVGWSLVAAAQCFDPDNVSDVSNLEAGVDFRLERTETLTVTAMHPGDPGKVDERSTKKTWVAGILTLGVVAAFALSVYLGSVTNSIVFGLIGAIMILTTWFLAYQYRLAGVAGVPQLSVEQPAGGGYRERAGRHELVVWMKPGAPISTVKVAIHAEERVETGSKTSDNFKVRKHALWEDTLELARTTPGEWRRELPLPTTPIAGSFDAGRGNYVRWRVELEVVLEDGSTIEDVFPLRARPD